jgi:hypothetical protein
MAWAMNHAPKVSGEPRKYTREELERRLEARRLKDADLKRRAEFARLRKAAKGVR